MRKRIECRISGRVQMVMYRDFTMRKARSLGVMGLVRNEEDGTVRVVAEGEEDALQEFIEQLRGGPLLSSVEGVSVSWMEPSGEFTSFHIRD